MKNILGALALLILAGPVSADDGTKYSPDPIITHEEAAGMGCWSCTTKSNGKKWVVILAEDRPQAEETAMKYCVSGGGDRDECYANMTCKIDNSHHPGPHEMKPFFDFGRGVNGYGYCYSFDANMQVMNNGMPVANFNCNLSKAYYGWGTGSDGQKHCYYWSPYGHLLDNGKAFDPVFCREGDPWPWDRARN